MFKTPRPKTTQIRPLPFPYRGAISISNDIEYFSLEFFEELNAFLNTDKNTKLGRGLNLEFTQSLFFYSHSEDSLSYFAGSRADGKKNQYSERLDEYLREGWIDTNHSFGDFGNAEDFTRAHAHSSYEAINKLGVQLPIFTVHGGYSNTQSIGPGYAHHKGDRPGTQQYHTDLFSAGGVRYVWSDCGRMVDEIQPHAQPASLKNKFFRFFEKNKSNAHPAVDRNLFLEYELQDGQIFKGFKRYRSTGPFAPNLSSFQKQIDSIDWKGMYENFGIHVIYQHFGVLNKTSKGITRASVDAIIQEPEIYLAPFYFLEEESKEGRLWIAGLFRFLQYVEMIENVELTTGSKGDIQISMPYPIQDPTEYFGGLTIYSSSKISPELVFGDTRIPVRENGLDESGRKSFTVPPKKMNSIW